MVWLPLLRETLGNMCILVICLPDCDVKNFEINFFFLIKPFFQHDQKELQYFENEKSFKIFVFK